MTRRIPRIASAALAIALMTPFGIVAQPRDGYAQERKTEEAAAACYSDARCTTELIRSEIREAQQRDEFEALPIEEKLLRWAMGLGIFAAAAGALAALFSIGKKRRR